MHRTAIAVSAVAAVVLVGSGVAVAEAATPATPAPSSTTSSAPTAGAAAKKHARVPLHADAVRRGPKGTFVTHDLQRGDITAVSATSLTMRSADGFTRTYVLDATTKVRIGKATAAAGDLKVGEKVRVRGVQAGSTWTAKRTVARSS
jgi:hypothetical protein